jgi:hypothetical protein
MVLLPRTDTARMNGSQSPVSRVQRMRALRQSVLTRKELWGWGTDAGLFPWGDRRRRTMVVLWQSEARAREENESPDAAPDEMPIRYSVADLQEKVPAWTRAGVRSYGLEPSGEDILYSLTPDEFLTFINSGLPVARKLP